MPVIECLNGEKILLDLAEYEKAKQYKWRIDSSKRGQIAVTIFNGKKNSLSRLVFGLTKGRYLFRKDSTKLDFSKDNIIICDSASMLRHFINFKKAHGSSKFFGVYFNDNLKKWVYEIRNRGKRYCGRYDSEFDAAIAAEYHYYRFYGQAVNFPDMSRGDIENLYYALADRVGDSASVRISKKLQGIKRNRIKTSKYVGVSRYKKTNRWIAQINYRRSRSMLGIFDKEEDAAKAYDLAAITFFGPDAKVNFPDIKMSSAFYHQHLEQTLKLKNQKI